MPEHSASPSSAPFSSSLYTSRVESATAGLPAAAAHTATDSIGGATAVAAHLPAGAGDALTAAAHGAFTDAIGLALLIGTGVLLAAALLVKRYLPDLRSAAATAGQADHQAPAARLEAHTPRATHVVEAPRTAHSS